MKNINENYNSRRKLESIYILHQGKKVRLSKRQQECIFFLVRGKTAKEIGKALSISYRTVEFYFEKLKGKLGCQTRREIIEQVLSNKNAKRHLL